MAGDAQVLVNHSRNKMSSEILTEEQECQIKTPQQQHKIDIDRIFSYKYPPDETNYKWYLLGLLLVIAVLVFTIIGVAMSPGHREFIG